MRAPARRGKRGFAENRSLQRSGEVLGVLLMALEDLQAGGEQILELAIVGGRDQRALQRTVDGLVIGRLILGIGLVEGGAVELLQLRALVARLLGEGLAGVVV